MPLSKHVIICKWENPEFFLHPDDDPDHSQNLMRTMLDQDPSSEFL